VQRPEVSGQRPDKTAVYGQIKGIWRREERKKERRSA